MVFLKIKMLIQVITFPIQIKGIWIWEKILIQTNKNGGLGQLNMGISEKY